MRCSNRKLLIVFEGSAQRERTLVCVTSLSWTVDTEASMGGNKESTIFKKLFVDISMGLSSVLTSQFFLPRLTLVSFPIMSKVIRTITYVTSNLPLKWSFFSCHPFLFLNPAVDYFS